jgi:hypothetical protein
MPDTHTLGEFLDKVPSSGEVRRRIAENIREGKLLRQLLRIADQRESVQEVAVAETEASG